MKIRLAAILMAGCFALTALAPAGAVTLNEGLKPSESARDVTMPKKEGPYKVGLSNISVANSWRVQMIEEARYQASQMPEIKELIVTDAGGDVNKQIADIEDLIARKVDVLLLAAGSDTALNPVIAKAADAGIPVIAFSSDVTSDRYSVRLLADETYFGRVGGEFLVKALGGKGDIIGLRGISGIAADQQRWDGAKSAFDAAPGIKVLDTVQADWAYDKAKAACENLIIAHPKIDGVWSSGGAMTQACAEVFRDAGLPLVPMSGEGNNGFLRVWKEYGLNSDAPLYPTWIGAEAVKASTLLLSGAAMKSDYMLRPEPIDKAAIDKYYRADLNDSYWVGSILPEETLKKTFGK